MRKTGSSSFSRLRGKTCFVGIGAQKAGTNWLADYLADHPQVCFSPIKELHYFDWRFCPEYCGGWQREFLRRLEKLEARLAEGSDPGVEQQVALLRKRLEMADRPEAYREFFDELIQPGQQAYGEITPSYSMIPALGYESMRRMLREPKVIWILRNPVDRYWSQLRFTMQQKEGFSAEERFVEELDSPQFAWRTDYARTLSNLFAELSPDEVLVLFYENLFLGDERAGELRRITSFLGVDFVPADFEKKIAPSVEVALAPDLRHHAVSHFAQVYRAIQEQFGPLPESWRRDLEAL